ncbi:MAG: hypothetical protein Q7T18_06720 [Sedimentisphaerales bacterium]|nr:hypothetical protein [Sedimentisphaerales bacterium]
MAKEVVLSLTPTEKAELLGIEARMNSFQNQPQPAEVRRLIVLRAKASK